jgi:hypothetical protein
MRIVFPRKSVSASEPRYDAEMCLDHFSTKRYFPGAEFYAGRLYQHWSPSVGELLRLSSVSRRRKLKPFQIPLLEYRILDEFGETFWDSQVETAAGENAIVGLFLEGLPCVLTARMVLRPAPTRLPSKSRVYFMTTPAANKSLLQVPRACHRRRRIYSRPCHCIPQQAFVVRSQSTRNHSVVTSKTIFSHRVGRHNGRRGRLVGL